MKSKSIWTVAIIISLIGLYVLSLGPCTAIRARIPRSEIDGPLATALNYYAMPGMLMARKTEWTMLTLQAYVRWWLPKGTPTGPVHRTVYR